MDGNSLVLRQAIPIALCGSVNRWTAGIVAHFESNTYRHARLLSLVMIAFLVACIGCGCGPRPKSSASNPLGEAPPPGQIPNPFPDIGWPASSATPFNVPRSLLSGTDTATLGQVADKLTATLTAAGYAKIAFFERKTGFAVVTPLEQIQEDGSPVRSEDRFRWQPSICYSGLYGYFHVLLRAQHGMYRVIVFIVDDSDIATTQSAPTGLQARDWSYKGADALKQSTRDKEFGPSHQCSVRIYQFYRPTGDFEDAQWCESKASAEAHLIKSNIWSKEAIDAAKIKAK